MPEQIEVLITHAFDEDQAARLQSVSPRLKLRIRPVRKAEEIPPDLWKKAAILYTNRTLPTPEQAPELAWIQFHSAGVEFALDAPILQKQDLVATSLSGASVGQMAEYIVMMLLALGRRLPELMDLQRKVEWPRERWERFMPQELANSIVGIVGYGSIGRQTARLLYALGAQVLATKKDAMHPEDTDYTPEGMGDPRGEYVHRLYPAQALKSMVRECDFVVVTVPLTENTHGLIGDEELAAFKPGAFMVDVSRGGVVDHTALVKALRDNQLGGAALDVFSQEPLPPESPLWKMRNVILTPHIAGISAHYDQRAADLFAENLNRYLSAMPLLNQIDLQREY